MYTVCPATTPQEKSFYQNLPAKRFSTEETKKGNRLEIIQSFDEKRNPTGILPRDSFLDTENS